MRASIVFLLSVVALATGASVRQHALTTIADHPSAVALLRTVIFATSQTACGGAILNNRSVLSAARCFESDGPERWRFRAGSTEWNSGGAVYQASLITKHDDWDEWALMSDIAIVQTTTAIEFNANVQPGSFAGALYTVPENDNVRTVGWGYNNMPVWSPSLYQSLRQVTHRYLNLEQCRSHYTTHGFWIRDTQICSGFIDPPSETSPRDTCFGEPGSPLYHNNAIVGIRSFTLSCGSNIEVPSINTRVSSFIKWIAENA